MAYGIRCKNCGLQETPHVESVDPGLVNDDDFKDLDHCIEKLGGYEPEDPVSEAIAYLDEYG